MTSNVRLAFIEMYWHVLLLSHEVARKILKSKNCTLKISALFLLIAAVHCYVVTVGRLLHVVSRVVEFWHDLLTINSIVIHAHFIIYVAVRRTGMCMDDQSLILNANGIQINHDVDIIISWISINCFRARLKRGSFNKRFVFLFGILVLYVKYTEKVKLRKESVRCCIIAIRFICFRHLDRQL